MSDYQVTNYGICGECKWHTYEEIDRDGCRKHWLKRDAVDYGGLMYWKRNTTYTGKDSEVTE